MEYVLRAAAVPGLNAMQQIECILEGANICKRLNLHRKYALLLYVASLMSAESNHTSMAHALVIFVISIAFVSYISLKNILQLYVDA